MKVNPNMLKVELGPTALAVEADTETGRDSIAFFCPGCGDVWGRVRRGPRWYAVPRPCAAHADHYRVGGSFFQGYDWTDFKPFLARHPLLAAHEFQVHLAWAERFLPANVQLELEI